MHSQGSQYKINYFGVTLPITIAIVAGLIYLILVGIQIKWYIPFVMIVIAQIGAFLVPRPVYFVITIAPIIVVPALAFCMFYFK